MTTSLGFRQVYLHIVFTSMADIFTITVFTRTLTPSLGFRQVHLHIMLTSTVITVTISVSSYIK